MQLFDEHMLACTGTPCSTRHTNTCTTSTISSSCRCCTLFRMCHKVSCTLCGVSAPPVPQSARQRPVRGLPAHAAWKADRCPRQAPCSHDEETKGREEEAEEEEASEQRGHVYVRPQQHTRFARTHLTIGAACLSSSACSTKPSPAPSCRVCKLKGAAATKHLPNELLQLKSKAAADAGMTALQPDCHKLLLVCTGEYSIAGHVMHLHATHRAAASNHCLLQSCVSSVQLAIVGLCHMSRAGIRRGLVKLLAGSEWRH